MVKILQVRNNFVCGEWRGAGALPEPPIDVVFITSTPFDNVVEHPERWRIIDPLIFDTIQPGDTFDIDTLVHTPYVRPAATLTKSDIIARFTPEEWSEMNQYHPNATEEKYRNPRVFWAMSIFNSAPASFTLNELMASNFMATLVTENVLTAERRDAIIS